MDANHPLPSHPPWKDEASQGLPWLERARLKVIGTALRGAMALRRLQYRLDRRPEGKLLHLDHITIPCDDLEVAEAFYVGVLGAKVMMRIDESLLKRMGWSSEQIVANNAVHLSLILQAGPRIDLFRYPQGKPGNKAIMHPHIAFMARPSEYLGWQKRLEQEGVITTEIMRPGPPGQASFYFNDPFGNHLEIVTLGFVDRKLAAGVPDRSQLNYLWSKAGPPQ